MAVVILLVGPTGSGRSSFVKAITGREDVGVGDVRPCTLKCATYDVEIGGGKFILIDTPGFGSSVPTNLGVLKSISEEMSNLRLRKLKVNASIFFHRITDGRMTGTVAQNLDTFKKMCGDGFFPQVAFATTHWDIVGPNGQPRYDSIHAELKRKHMNLGSGAVNSAVHKFKNDWESAVRLLKHCETVKNPSVEMLFATELESKGWGPKAAQKTTAGRAEVKRKSAGGGSCQIL
ncbi:P-loop containing nucleoside triphosphate hydrolase protein [Podospora aff. communis PSN243]|uniref:P-loop containing nucleoside triphosphate hydrolase protein n=1 Tax=Podospora aff. communis PSN243 TaxID=3040156 RepID=A0AAV9GS55_9PEZI|nr:P-loop containing nucleoside triphosphate hydrolase protein [Podospora aff. communis PSN243]